MLVFAGGGTECRHVFGKARAAPAQPRGEETGPYTVVEADAVGHLRYVCADQLAEVGDLVYEADLGGQEGVCSVLDHLRARQVRGYERYCDLGTGVPFRGEALLHYRGVQGSKGVEGLPGVRPHHHAIREEGVVDGAALPQKLWVGSYPELGSLAARLFYAITDQRGNVVGASHRYRALVDDDQRVLAGRRCAERAAYRTRHVGHVREVRRSVAALWRADGHEEDVRPSYDLIQPLGAGKSEPSCAPGYELLQARLVEGDLSLSEVFHSLVIVVQAYHLVPDVSQAGARGKPDVTRANDTHLRLLHAIYVPLHALGSRPDVHNRDVTGRRNTRLAEISGAYFSGLVRLATAF